MDEAFEKEIENLKRQFKDKCSLYQEHDTKIVYKLKSFHTSDPDFPSNVLKNGVIVYIHIPKNFPDKWPRFKVNKEGLTENEFKHVPTINEKIFRRVKSIKAKPGQFLRSGMKLVDKIISSHQAFYDLSSMEMQLFEKNKQKEEWTVHQQTCFEEALGKYLLLEKLSLKERWLSISRDVPGKNAEQCLLRYNTIRDQIQNEQQQEDTDSIQEMPESDTKNDENSSVDSGRSIVIVSNLRSEDYEKLKPNECSKIQIEGLGNTNIIFLQPMSMDVLLQCLYCSHSFEKSLTTEPDRYWCPKKKCGHVITSSLITIAMHEQNLTAVGVLESKHSSIVDIQSISFLASCESCENQEEIKTVTRGQPKEINCKSCHKKLRIKFQSIDVLDTREANSKPKAWNGTKKVRDQRIVPGSPLPLNGTCKHYRKSNRWLRFPCCNRAFPCDVCHDMETKCEEPKRAGRMICGFCSCEQPFSNDKPCKKCKKAIGPQKRTSHWEGGKGCRNKKLMSTKDKKKYSNSKNKTLSNKSNRVGPKTHRN